MHTITEDDINQWASYIHDAEDVLPDLIRHILYALLPGANLSFPAYRATNLSGYDGVLITSAPTIFSDTQTSVWEISVREDVTTKANSDYNTRTADPLGKDKTDTTYIALSGRRWANKEKWIEEKKKEGQWADVRAYDATDIAQWLIQIPQVSIWFASEILGKSLDGITSVNHYFREWSYRTHPALNEAIILAGRQEQVQIFHNWLRDNHKPLSIRAETIEECIIFSCAAILVADEPEKDNWIARTLIITSDLAWERIIKTINTSTSSSPLILLPRFDDFDGSTVISQHHYLLLPSETGQVFRNPDILLHPMPRGELAKALTAVVSNKDNAEKLAYESGGKITALQRLLGYTRKSPAWVNQSNNLQIGLLLAGMWYPDNVNDRAILSELCIVDSYEEIEKYVNVLMTISDAPLRRQGRAIKWRSIKDTWQLLASRITSSDLQRFKTVCIQSLKKHDPKYDLPLEDRMFAGIHGNTLAESGYIRRGISESLAWLALNKEEIERNLGAYSVSNVVDEVVWSILDSDWKVWATLGESLSNFAEASPNEFLRSVDKVIKDPNKGFEQLFNQDPKNTGISAECCHSGLLWALEILAWNPQYFPRVASTLAALCEIDPGGQYANRPDGSLLSIFHPLAKQTSVPNNQREATLRGIFKRYASCAWPLLQNLVGIYSRGGVITPNNRPKFNDWVLPETFESYPYQEITDYFKVLRELLLGNLESNPPRLVELLENQDISILASELLQIIESNLEVFRETEFQLRYRIQNALRNHIADWQITQESRDENIETITRASKLVELLESEDQAENFAWLFPDSYLELPEPREWDWEKREEHLASLRENALLELLKSDYPLQQIERLSELSKNPRLAGLTLGRISIASKYQQEILENFLPRKDHGGEFALGFVVSSYFLNGFEWLKSVVQNLFSEGLFLSTENRPTWPLKTDPLGLN